MNYYLHYCLHKKNEKHPMHGYILLTIIRIFRFRDERHITSRWSNAMVSGYRNWNF